jgi:hypothetical protein
VIRAPRCAVKKTSTTGVGETIFKRTKCVLLVSDVTLLRQTFALLLEGWTGLRTVQADSLAGGRGLLADLNGNVALAVVSVDTADGPGAGLIEHLNKLGLPVLAFGLEESTVPLARALDAGADDAISLESPMSHFIDKAAQLVMTRPAEYRRQDGTAITHEARSGNRGFPLPRE